MTPRAAPAGAASRRGLLRALAIALAVAYPLALLSAVLALRFVGERWWVTTVAIYLPRIGFALPLPFAVIAAGLWAPRRYLALQALSAGLLLFPLMGFSLGTGRLANLPSSPSLRVVSYNIGFGGPRTAVIWEEVRSFSPDLVLVQDAHAAIERGMTAAFSGWHVRRDGEFAVASRHPIAETSVPPPLVYAQGTGGAHFVRYAIDTPLGIVDVFNVHTTSPRAGLEEVRGSGIREEVASGRLFVGKAAGPVEFNAYRRRRQIEGLAAAVRASRRAVVVAGDTNLPGLSWILNEYLGPFHDAFEQAGWGFGYTFPSHRPWMRIDRILTNDRLRAVDFGVGGGTASDHRLVCAVLAAGR